MSTRVRILATIGGVWLLGMVLLVVRLMQSHYRVDLYRHVTVPGPGYDGTGSVWSVPGTHTNTLPNGHYDHYAAGSFWVGLLILTVVAVVAAGVSQVWTERRR